MSLEYFQAPDHFVLPADSKISRGDILFYIYGVALYLKDISKITIDASRVYWISPFTACWFAALHDELAAIGRKYELVPPGRKTQCINSPALGLRNI